MLKKVEKISLIKTLALNYFQENFGQEKAKELGLVDEIGNINQVLRDKFGKDVVIKKFENQKVGYLKNFHLLKKVLKKLLVF